MALKPGIYFLKFSSAGVGLGLCGSLPPQDVILGYTWGSDQGVMVMGALEALPTQGWQGTAPLIQLLWLGAVASGRKFWAHS